MLLTMLKVTKCWKDSAQRPNAARGREKSHDGTNERESPLIKKKKKKKKKKPRKTKKKNLANNEEVGSPPTKKKKLPNYKETTSSASRRLTLSAAKNNQDYGDRMIFYIKKIKRHLLTSSKKRGVNGVGEKEWELGIDLDRSDNLMDGFTFDDIILQVHCNCREITEQTVRKEVLELATARLDDMCELLNRNIGVIMTEARKGREF